MWGIPDEDSDVLVHVIYLLIQDFKHTGAQGLHGFSAILQYQRPFYNCIMKFEKNKRALGKFLALCVLLGNTMFCFHTSPRSNLL